MTPWGLSDEQMAGQHLILGFDGVELTPRVRFLIKDLHAGGLILFSRNVTGPEQLGRLCADLQAYAADCGEPPLFIAIDQEGGPVARLKPPFTQFPGNPKMKNDEDADWFARVCAWELMNMGINMNLAPVLDVAPADMPSIMAGRSFGSDPDWVAHMGRRVIDGFQRAGVMAVVKHFPGIGRTVLDSHKELPVMDADLTDLTAYDLKPFVAAFEERPAAVMLSHILYPALDPVWPASLSPAIASRLLRRDLRYDGVVMIDDADMAAVAAHFSITDIVRQICLSEVDILLICHDGPKAEAAFSELMKIRETLPDGETLTLQSIGRIWNLKKRFLRV